MTGPVKIGVGGPVGSGKTALLNVLCTRMRERYEIGVVTNDIYTQEDAQILMRAEALPFERISSPSKIASVASGVERARSVSSIRRRKRPPV